MHQTKPTLLIMSSLPWFSLVHPMSPHITQPEGMENSIAMQDTFAAAIATANAPLMARLLLHHSPCLYHLHVPEMITALNNGHRNLVHTLITCMNGQELAHIIHEVLSLPPEHHGILPLIRMSLARDTTRQRYFDICTTASRMGYKAIAHQCFSTKACSQEVESTALYEAIKHGHLEIVRDICSMHAITDHNPLFRHAIKYNQATIATFFMNFADVITTYTDKNGCTALMDAVEHQDPACLRLLLCCSAYDDINELKPLWLHACSRGLVTHMNTLDEHIRFFKPLSHCDQFKGLLCATSNNNTGIVNEILNNTILSDQEYQIALESAFMSNDADKVTPLLTAHKKQAQKNKSMLMSLYTELHYNSEPYALSHLRHAATAGDPLLTKIIIDNFAQDKPGWLLEVYKNTRPACTKKVLVKALAISGIQGIISPCVSAVTPPKNLRERRGFDQLRLSLLPTTSCTLLPKALG